MRNILIVDDIITNRKVIGALLLKSLDDIEILEAENGLSALEIIQREEIHVVILDIMMPIIDGIEVLTVMKESEETSKIPVIMCSAVHEMESIEKALSLGALDYFTKPLHEDDMRIMLPLKVKNALEVYERESRLAMLYEQVHSEMVLAARIQKAIIAERATYDTATIYGKYVACEEIGGDLFCSQQVGDDVWFFVADVAGHGIGAALISTMLSSVFYVKLETCREPSRLLMEINSYLCTMFASSFMGLISAFIGCIRGNELLYSNAGHPYPVYFDSKKKKVEAIDVNGPLLGFLEDAEYITRIRKVKKNDLVVLYTDGIFDKNVSGGYGVWEKVYDYCNKNKNLFEGDIDEFLRETVKHFRSDEESAFIDDVAVFAIQKK